MTKNGSPLPTDKRQGEPLKLGELFAGYGGLGMAVEDALNARLVWTCEFEAAPSKILAYHWDVPNYGDVTKIDWHKVEPVDIISGGSPCQDLSLAGKRAGMQTGTRSNLWESMREGIAIIRPRHVVWENVRGALSAKATSVSDVEPGSGPLGDGSADNLRAIGRVLGDLAELGYDCQWRGLRAADVGAPHGRFRVFILATRRDAATDASSGGRPEAVEHDGRPPQEVDRASVPHEPDRVPNGAGSDGSGNQAAADSHDVGHERIVRRGPAKARPAAKGDRPTATDPGGEHRDERRKPAPRKAKAGKPSAVDSGRRGTSANADAGSPGLEGHRELQGEAGETEARAHGKSGTARPADTARRRRNACTATTGSEGHVAPGRCSRGEATPDARRSAVRGDTGKPSAKETRAASGHGPGDPHGKQPDPVRREARRHDDCERIAWGDYEPAVRRWEATLGRRAPAPTEPTGRNGNHRLSARFVEWMMGLPEGHVTDPAIGISRNDQLKALGNGVVPQQAAFAITDMLRKGTHK